MNSYQTKFVNHYVRPFITDSPQKGYTMAGLSLITVIVFGQFALIPAISSVIKTSNTLAEGIAASQKLTVKIAALKEGQNSLTRYQPQIKLLEDAKIGTGDNGKIISRLASLSEKSSVHFDFYQKGTVGGTTGSESSFWVGISGDFNNLINFLKGINSAIPTATVESINLSKDKIVQATILVSISRY